jgi:hypothetical protein
LEFIEENFYGGEASSDFELILRPDGNAIAMAHKRRMSRSDLFSALEKVFDVSFPTKDDPQRDIMVLSEGASPEHQAAVVALFRGWLRVQ